MRGRLADADRPEEYGGQGLPQVVGTAISEYVLSANHSFEMYQGLTSGAIASLLVKGIGRAQADLRAQHGHRQMDRHHEPDRAALRHRSRPAQDPRRAQADGSYAITGTKIFISSGEHDLAENIIHLVLAKIAGAPDNVKGISLFVVPKFLVNADGSLGERNAVSLRRAREEDGHPRQRDLRDEL